MQKRVLFRTAKKLGSFFGFLFIIISGIFLSAWAGKHLFDDPMIGNLLFFGISGISALCYFAYREAKYEVETEDHKLIQELTKHG